MLQLQMGALIYTTSSRDSQYTNFVCGMRPSLKWHSSLDCSLDLLFTLQRGHVHMGHLDLDPTFDSVRSGQWTCPRCFPACNFVIRQRSSSSQYSYSKFTTDIIISCIFIGLDQRAHVDQCPDIIINMTCALPRFTYRIPVFLGSVA